MTESTICMTYYVSKESTICMTYYVSKVRSEPKL